MFDALIQDLAGDFAFKRNVRSVSGQVEDLQIAYDIQDRLRPYIGKICGRKIAANAPALMNAAGLDTPIFGLIIGQEALLTESVLCISDYAQLVLEPEFAAVVGRNVPAGMVLSTEILSEYVDRFSMAFEVLDRRNDTQAMHGPTYVVNNVFNAGVVLDDAKLDLNVLEQGAYAANFTESNKILFSGENTAPQNPLEACVCVINHFTARGETVKSGEVVLCGAHHPPIVISAEGRYDFRLSSGEEVSLTTLV